MPKLSVRRLGYALGAEVRGADATKPLDDETVAEIRQALLDHIVVCLPGQDLNPEQLREFSERFGELDLYNPRAQANLHPTVTGVIVRSNVAVNVEGKKIQTPPVDKWHSDYAHSIRPATFTVMNSKATPDVGGNTLFTNLYMAYETLSPALQRMLEPLTALHDITLAPTYGRSDKSQKDKYAGLNPPGVHPLIRVHSETGRKALFISDRIRNFIGMTEEETKPILDFLQAHATRYEFTYRHVWGLHDLLLWDNRCSLHNAVSDFDNTQLRTMIRTSLVDPLEAPAESAPAQAEAVTV